MTQNKDIVYVFYDNNCAFCKETIAFFKKKTSSILFQPIQERSSRTILKNNGIHFINYNTIYYVHNNNVYIKSKAIFSIINNLKFPYRLVNVFSILPLKITDWIYQIISKNRYKIMKSLNTEIKEELKINKLV